MSDDKCAETCVAPAPTKPIEEPLPNRVPRVHSKGRQGSAEVAPDGSSAGGCLRPEQPR